MNYRSFSQEARHPRCAEPHNSLQLKAGSEAIRIAGIDLLFQMVSNLSSQQLSLSRRNPPGISPVLMGMLLLPPRAAPTHELCRLMCTHPAEKPTARNWYYPSTAKPQAAEGTGGPRTCRCLSHSLTTPNATSFSNATKPGHFGSHVCWHHQGEPSAPCNPLYRQVSAALGRNFIYTEHHTLTKAL